VGGFRSAGRRLVPVLRERRAEESTSPKGEIGGRKGGQHDDGPVAWFNCEKTRCPVVPRRAGSEKGGRVKKIYAGTGKLGCEGACRGRSSRHSVNELVHATRRGGANEKTLTQKKIPQGKAKVRREREGGQRCQDTIKKKWVGRHG